MAAHLLVQLSDLHLCSGGVLRNGARTTENLRAAVALIARHGLAPDLVICSGDLADDGEEASYEELAALVAPLAGTATRLVFLPGNHDERRAFRRHLLGATAPSTPGEDDPVNQVVHHGGLRVVALDSSVPGAEHGELSEKTLDFLRTALVEPAPDGTVVALHHPPIPSPINSMAAIALRAPERLAEVIAGSDVRLVLAGHNHHAAASTLGGIPVWVSPAVAYRADVASTDEFRPVPGAALTRIDLPAQGAPLLSILEVPRPSP